MPENLEEYIGGMNVGVSGIFLKEGTSPKGSVRGVTPNKRSGGGEE